MLKEIGSRQFFAMGSEGKTEEKDTDVGKIRPINPLLHPPITLSPFYSKTITPAGKARSVPMSLLTLIINQLLLLPSQGRLGVS